ncbi:molybdenum cofactor guanylyltransferase [Planococcus kocurii]|uniref:Probable molybdenum cofactor guanylyltransferase n=1 Tax=Planococcus kocurii TaxID=1374 RepID=A0AAC9A352_9BACL|nr:molybdenum cofactor guanylyltransferase [Planococcus kocurii]ALS78665.1 molybdopterin-guanine dinucleotide biosynthesis protein MobA [Planococcus kocurii]
MKSTVGILLAGGLSRRFGSPKAFAELAGIPFYEHAYKALTNVCDHVVIISRPELITRFPSKYDVITDLDWIAGQGPLAGIFSGMNHMQADNYLVLPCDMPFVGPAETAKLLALTEDSSDISAVWNTTEKIPLFSVWDICVQEPLQKELETGQLRVMKFMEKVTTQWINSSEIHKDQLVFRNVNQPDD